MFHLMQADDIVSELSRIFQQLTVDLRPLPLRNTGSGDANP